jgi:exosortase E/protease (VPEID-CTERM system)
MSAEIVCPAQRGTLPLVRWIGLGILLAVEVLGLSLRFDTDTLRGQPGVWSALFAHAHYLPPIAIAVIAAIALFGGRRLGRELQRLSSTRLDAHSIWLFLVGHFVALGVFFRLTAILLEAHVTPASRGIWAILWTLTGVVVFGLWCLAALPAAVWLRIGRRCAGPLTLAAVAAVLACGAGMLTGFLWAPLRESTFWLVRTILNICATHVVCDADTAVVGTRTFRVHIAPECSGYEGIGLVCVFLGVYLFLFRRHLRFPQALLLVPLGAVAVYLLNAVRIAALVLVGSHLSREVAAGGFHSQAGWIAFNGVALGAALLSRRLRFFSTDAVAPREINPTAVYLTPLLALLATSMLTGAFSSGFDRLYPLRVVAVVAVLVCFRDGLTELRWGWSWTAVGIGGLVYGLWLLLEPLHATADNTVFADGLASMPAGGAVAWLIFRAVGSVLTVPLAEELAFRGYLTRRLQAADFTAISPGRLTTLALIVSSLVFGALHGRWLAGSLAGALYAWAYHRRGRLTDAVLAHATTNGLLTLHVLATQNWSLWS